MKQLVFFCFLIFTNFIQGFGQDNVLLSNTNKHDSVNNSHKFLDLFNIGMPKTVFDSIIKNKNWKLVFINRDSLYINSDSFDIYLDKYLNIYQKYLYSNYFIFLNDSISKIHLDIPYAQIQLVLEALLLSFGRNINDCYQTSEYDDRRYNCAKFSYFINLNRSYLNVVVNTHGNFYCGSISIEFNK